ncbi:hypothetical protein D3P09_17545 [Paenibacillus pinisoli]|uniref:Carboxypeptidase regulatory-like domain-containing protein n=1 Tax=Paenibacillus pinisoli TaxID=1276110 RepID=A0A3A6PC64_9BACL|nr:hypothetical protein [Paenibacillus pinisoli]RJX37895.1 hypothetical protein D3P09_17545 [Paenibacillus pinisoli]
MMMRLRKKAITIMIFSAILMALLPVLQVNAGTRYPLTPPAYGFYELVTGSGKLVVGAIGEANHPIPEAYVPAMWTLTIQAPNGDVLYSQNQGSYVVLDNLPYGTYKITFQVGNIWTINSYFSAVFQ